MEVGRASVASYRSGRHPAQRCAGTGRQGAPVADTPALGGTDRGKYAPRWLGRSRIANARGSS